MGVSWPAGCGLLSAQHNSTFAVSGEALRSIAGHTRWAAAEAWERCFGYAFVIFGFTTYGLLVYCGPIVCRIAEGSRPW